jgi:two-component system, NtrC family, response regulator GlrR
VDELPGPESEARTLSDGGPSRAVRKLRLLDASGNVVGELFRPRSSIGHQEANDVVLDDPTVSRFHCEILLDDGAARVRDLDSRNGTFVDGTRIGEAWLRDGAELRLGRTGLRARLEAERVEQPLSERSELGSLYGESVAMRAVFSLIEKAAPTDATVLLEGETGTGKEGAAEAIHQLSARREKPLVVVDCAAIPAGLLESELFGHDKGAFTGAIARRTGAFAEADGGTVFLDEIGELPLELQPKLLRFLERREIRRVGTNHMERVDVRVIAATHRDLRSAVNRHAFRADLYFRLSVVRVTLPPLRERLDDVPLLARQLLRRMRAGGAGVENLLRPEFLRALQLHSWPGNVRELRNYLERCLVFEQQMPIGDGDAPEPASFSQARQRAIDAFERQYLLQLIAAHGGKVTQAAQEAGVGRAHLYRLLHKHGLTPRGVAPGTNQPEPL